MAYDWEGADITKFLNGKGIVGIVLKYRLPSDVSQKDKHYVPFIDAQRALFFVISKAKTYHINPEKIGIIGFSAGEHLTSTLGTHFDEKVYEPVYADDTVSARPDFMTMGYPVIIFGLNTHGGSKKKLIGKNP